jgi:4-diphosphocytidyl-2-C-methyl-D-erythritol kinase
MSQKNARSLTVFAPAKINLFLHVTGRRDDGYHMLDSLVGFADIGDKIEFQPAREFSFNIKGPFAGGFNAKDKDASPDSGNLVARAAWDLARAARRDLNCRITLHKNLPLASGVGGGSSDAAATLWGLMDLWGLNIKNAAPYLVGLMEALGADVPVCMECKPAMIRGVSTVEPLEMTLPEMPVLLVNPARSCMTNDIFRQFDGAFKKPVSLPDDIAEKEGFVEFLKQQSNDLTAAAAQDIPEISAVLSLLDDQKGCVLSRMSGSGATCFGLFEDEEAVMDAAEQIMLAHPKWWVRGGTLNRPVRY